MKLLDILPAWVSTDSEAQVLHVLTAPTKRRRDDEDELDAA